MWFLLHFEDFLVFFDIFFNKDFEYFYISEFYWGIKKETYWNTSELTNYMTLY